MIHIVPENTLGIMEYMKMELIVKKALLYDFYGELLTEHQKSIYSDFILNDIGISEIAAERGISRQGVHEMIKRCDKMLADYEDRMAWAKKMLINTAKAGFFSSDRTIAEYNRDIWKL